MVIVLPFVICLKRLSGFGPWVVVVVGVAGCQFMGDRPTNAISSQASNSPPPPHLASDQSPVPPLITATLTGDEDEVRLLLEAGTDPNMVYQTNTALTYAARDGLTAIAHDLVRSGADVNWVDGEGVTPLILAAFKGHQDIVVLLLAHHADITPQDQWGRTALDYALRRGKEDPIAQLIQQSVLHPD